MSGSFQKPESYRSKIVGLFMAKRVGSDENQTSLLVLMGHTHPLPLPKNELPPTYHNLLRVGHILIYAACLPPKL